MPYQFHPDYPRATAVKVNVSDQDQVKPLFVTIELAFQLPVNILVNTAGLLTENTRQS